MKAQAAWWKREVATPSFQAAAPEVTLGAKAHNILEPLRWLGSSGCADVTQRTWIELLCYSYIGMKFNRGIIIIGIHNIIDAFLQPS